MPKTLDDLSALATTRLTELIEATALGRPVVRLGLCNHVNVGDVALNVAESRLIRAAGVCVRSLTTSDKPNPAIREIAEDAAIIVQGGGNIGDLYGGELALRVAALEDYRTHPILQMPQSIYFENLTAAEGYRSAVSRARNYVLLVRDQASYDWASNYLDCRVELVPDSVLSLGRLARPIPPSRSMIALIRGDRESRGKVVAVPPDGVIVDWPTEGRTRHDWALWSRWLPEFVEAHGRQLPLAMKAFAIERLSGTRLRRGMTVLAEGERVLTDRLHGHILSSLLGIPQLVMDNSYGKVWGFMDTWQMDALVPVIRVDDLSSAEKLEAAIHRLDERFPLCPSGERGTEGASQ